MPLGQICGEKCGEKPPSGRFPAGNLANDPLAGRFPTGNLANDPIVGRFPTGNGITPPRADFRREIGVPPLPQ